MSCLHAENRARIVMYSMSCTFVSDNSDYWESQPFLDQKMFSCARKVCGPLRSNKKTPQHFILSASCQLTSDKLRCSLLRSHTMLSLFLGRVIPRREAADTGALTWRRAAAADGANEAVGSLATNWAVRAKTGVRHLFVTEEHLVASRPSTGPSLSLWCDINSLSSQTERKERKKETRGNDKQTEDWRRGGGGRR